MDLHAGEENTKSLHDTIEVFVVCRHNPTKRIIEEQTLWHNLDNIFTVVYNAVSLERMDKTQLHV